MVKKTKNLAGPRVLSTKGRKKASEHLLWNGLFFLSVLRVDARLAAWLAAIAEPTLIILVNVYYFLTQ
jgi:hypothetical protein